ncbi:MAG: hypothetical protein F6K42_28485 [Leptolyngbya sp. SIO1D8]|nr:hypothetical protein [Leptolyngbya sp. SIO1D8]
MATLKRSNAPQPGILFPEIKSYDAGYFAELKAQGEIPLVCSHKWGNACLLLLNRRAIANDIPQAVMT